ncbi:KGK domain-containing protein [Microcoleus sp. CAWBG58]|uniref:KGK domain-containing protein n=1 Tax=Microcoleus sp. CAWBG58 TaxID=2841651 RepID=UPI0025EF7DEA|nr:KGK domain-containing protein [Microcoleus sp. CAWBG58]
MILVTDSEASIQTRSDKTYTTHDFMEMIAGFLKSYLFGNSFDLWTKSGVHCNLLKVGSPGWTQGKIRVRFVLEFAPDEPNNET